ncbi:hypothetical protein ACMYM1_23570, partial [Salmonella enterica subsp. enterica serovar Enteritidis]|uniref:hypothetical protein n=1 Tax=Salmonella enterica TaxID=28901 RepID=UPI0039ED8B51
HGVGNALFLARIRRTACTASTRRTAAVGVPTANTQIHVELVIGTGRRAEVRTLTEVAIQVLAG